MATAAFKQNIKVRSGNRIVVLLGGIQVGSMQSVSASDDYGLEAASGIGDARPFEHVPGLARHSVNVSSLVLFKNSLLEAGIAPENSTANMQGLVFDFEIYDKDSGKLLRKYISCSYASGSIEVNKHAMLMQSAVFMALDVQEKFI
jgi:hypothetical protein